MDDVQLQTFSESLSPPSEYVDLAKRTIQKVFLLLQKNSRHRLDRVRVVGGIEKKSSTAIKADIDAVIYFNGINNNVMKSDIVDDFQKILLLNTNLKENAIHITKNNSMKLTMDGVPIDLLVGVNMVVNPTDVASQQSHNTLQLIKQSADPQKVSEMNSAELSESSLEFIKSKSKFVHDVTRLAKFWNQTILFKTYVFGRSLIMELLAVDAAMEEENNKSSSISKAFKGYLKRVNHMKSQEIIFQDYYKVSDIPMSIRKQKPLLMDPSNPYNNLLHVPNTKDGQHFMEVFQYCAGVTYDMMSNGCKDINLIFYPQPLLYQLQKKEKWIKPKDRTYEVGVISSWLPFKEMLNAPLMPGYILRDPQGAEHQYELSSLLFTLAGFIYSTTMLNSNMPNINIRNEVEAFFEKTTGLNVAWVELEPESLKHDKRAVTMVVPVNDPKKRFVLLSFDFFVVKK